MEGRNDGSKEWRLETELSNLPDRMRNRGGEGAIVFGNGRRDRRYACDRPGIKISLSRKEVLRRIGGLFNDETDSYGDEMGVRREHGKHDRTDWAD